MPTPAQTAGWSFRQVAIGLAVLVSLLSVQFLVSPELGVSFTALAMIIGLVVVVAVALPELERDVLQFGFFGAILGGAGESLLISADSLLHGVLLGAIVGALVGDEVQLSRKWFKLVRQAREERRWWQKLSLESNWLPRAVWIGCGVALVLGIVLLAVLKSNGMSPRDDLRVVSDFFEHFRDRRLAAWIWSDLGYMWFAIIPLGMSVALSRMAARVPQQALLVDGILRRVAILQCTALFLLALEVAHQWVVQLSTLSHTSLGSAAFLNDHYEFLLNIQADSLRFALIPLLMLMVSQIFLGKGLFRYWQRSGWIVALGMLSLMSVYVLGFLLIQLFASVA
ncbi:MAG TPA: hypothetical protein VL096_09840 [Pirellulaceae bacterium]|nr:hypothetical protein [Pirellulaceae bacterium]